MSAFGGKADMSLASIDGCFRENSGHGAIPASNLCRQRQLPPEATAPALALRASPMRYFSLAAARQHERLPASFPAASRTKTGEASSSETPINMSNISGL